MGVDIDLLREKIEDLDLGIRDLGIITRMSGYTLAVIVCVVEYSFIL
jgi:hypothetical protein